MTDRRSSRRDVEIRSRDIGQEGAPIPRPGRSTSSSFDTDGSKSAITTSEPGRHGSQAPLKFVYPLYVGGPDGFDRSSIHARKSRPHHLS